MTLPADAGTDGYFLKTNGSGVTSWAAAGSGSPGGSNTNVQFNSSSTFGGDSNFIWDNTNKRLGVGIATTLNYDIQVSRDSAAASFAAYAFGSTASYVPELRTFRARGSYASPSAVSSGDVIGHWGASGYGTSYYIHVGSIEFIARGTYSSSSGPTTLRFLKSNDSAASESSYLFHNVNCQAMYTLEAYTSYDNFTLSMSGTEYLRPTVIAQRVWGGTTGQARDAALIAVHGSSSTANEGGWFWAMRSSGLTSRSIVTNGDSIGGIQGIAYCGDATFPWTRIGSIAFEMDGTLSTSAMPSRITLWTVASGGKTLSERMRITNAGYVHIGSTAGYSTNGTTVSYMLQISGADSDGNNNGIAQEVAAGNTRINSLRCNGSFASKTVVANNDVIAAFNGLGWDGGTTPTYNTAAGIQFVVDGTVAEDSVPGRIAFWTRLVGNTSGTTERIRIDNAGKLYSYQMYSGYTVGGTNKAVYVDSTGMIGVLSSSRRTKQDIVDMEDIGWIDRLRPVNFCYRSTPGVKQYGLIAEEVEDVNKDLVGYDWEGLPDSVTYDRLVPVLLKAVRELRSELAQIKAAMLP